MAEPPDGPWVHVCAIELTGPDRDEERAQGEGRHTTRRQARRTAVTNACARTEGGAECTGSKGTWRIATQSCAQIEVEGRDRVHRCKVTVERPAGPPVANEQTESKTADKACDRARRRACKRLRGGPECRALSAGWSVRETRARRRP